MDINKLLMGFSCGCGKTHHCDIEYVYIEDNAIAHLAELCTDYHDVLLAATMSRCTNPDFYTLPLTIT